MAMKLHTIARSILGLPLETPFETGFRQGRQSGEYVTNRQVHEAFPVFSASDVDAYQNGRDDGVRGDTTRIDKGRAAALWPYKDWSAIQTGEGA